MTKSAVDDSQAALWNGGAGRAWVDEQELMDQVLEPFETLLVEQVTYGEGARVLDVGCGTGTTTLAVAQRTRVSHCTGIDISETVIAAARARAERDRARATFICADAQSHAFSPASFDAIISRFGVMFFADPVAAFANLRRAARDGAALRFVAWRSAAENPFMTTAERAAAPLLPDMPPRDHDAPGQFALADRERVRRILSESGWTDIDIRPIDPVCTFPEPQLVTFFTRLGPLGRMLDQKDEQTRRRVAEAVRPAFDRYVDDGEVRVVASCWDVSARAGAG
jgi:SAM-dependent methyltransferase